MGFLKNLFRKKEVEVEKKVEVQEGRTFIDHPCELCQKRDKEILGKIGYEKWTKKNGVYMHKSCYKKTIKQAKLMNRI